jgi:hypothetical protein
MIYKRLRSTIAAVTLQRCGTNFCLLVALLSGAGVASASLIYQPTPSAVDRSSRNGSCCINLIFQLTPAAYSTTPGGTVEIFASVTNTGPDTLLLAYSDIGPGLPVAGVVGPAPRCSAAW